MAEEHERIFQRTGSRRVVPEARIRDIEAHIEVHLEGRLEKLAALMKKLASDLEQSELPDVDAEIIQDLRNQWEKLNANFEETEEPDVQEKDQVGEARES